MSKFKIELRIEVIIDEDNIRLGKDNLKAEDILEYLNNERLHTEGNWWDSFKNRKQYIVVKLSPEEEAMIDIIES